MPPAAGPSTAPRMPAATQSRTARASSPAVCRSRPIAAVTTSAAPAACTQRAASSTSNDGASPHASEAAAKTAVPATNAVRGRRRATNAAGTHDDREHEVERGEHPGHGRDPEVELGQDLRQRERDDRGIREREPDRETEQP